MLGGNCVVDDLVIATSTNVNTAIYATDLNSFQIYKYDFLTETASVINSDISVLCSVGDTNPDLCTGYPQVQGPNGIALYTDSSGVDWLIIAISAASYGFVKMSLDGTIATRLSPGLNTPPSITSFTFDGIALYGSGRNAVIYAATSDYADNMALVGAVQVFSSIDEWVTFDIRTVYNASCQQLPANDRVTAVRFGGADFDDLIVQCNNNFVGSPQFFNVLDGIAGDPVADTIAVYATIPATSPPENFLYDPNNNMIVFGSCGNPPLGIVGYPYPNSGIWTMYIFDHVGNPDVYITTYNNSMAHQYIPSGSLGAEDAMGNALGLVLSEIDTCFAYVVSAVAAWGDGVPMNPSYLYSVNLCSNSVIDVVKLPQPDPNSNGGGGWSLGNDVTILNGDAYVTDTLANQVVRIPISESNQLGQPEIVVTPSRCADNNATYCMVSPDGIRAFDNYLLISTILNVAQSTGYPSSMGALFKYVPSTDTLTVVHDPTGVMNDFDKIVFNEDKSILFGTRNDVNPESYSTIMAMASCDDWESNNLLYSFQADCEGNTNPPGIDIVNGDLVSLCANGFGEGPYNLQRVRDVTNVVTGGKNFCGVSTDTSDDGCPVTTCDDDDCLSDGGIAGIAIATFVVGTIIAAVVSNYFPRVSGSKSGTEMSTTNPMSSA